MTTKVKDTAEVTSAKATQKVVAKIDELATVRAEIARLEKVKDALLAEVNEIFDTEGSDLLVHRNIEVARRDWRSRTTTDDKKLEVMFPEAFEATRKTSVYSVIVALYKKSK